MNEGEFLLGTVEKIDEPNNQVIENDIMVNNTSGGLSDDKLALMAKNREMALQKLMEKKRMLEKEEESRKQSLLNELFGEEEIAEQTTESLSNHIEDNFSFVDEEDPNC